LAALIGRIAPEVTGAVFDFGSGGAPYAGLFTQCAGYVAADLEPGPTVDRVLRPDGLTNEAAASYDFVLSTQVLEHVQNARQYLQECRRILRPGGRILLTTHGMFEEHGCPHDYQRWTAAGLEGLFHEAGFEVIESGKLTTEIRGIVQLMNYFAHHLRYPKNRLLHLPLAVVRKLHVKALTPLLNKFADVFDKQAVVKTPCDDSIYVAVFVHARKPASAGNGPSPAPRRAI
jgi:SAM-dependent methyltransferase